MWSRLSVKSKLALFGSKAPESIEQIIDILHYQKHLNRVTGHDMQAGMNQLAFLTKTINTTLVNFIKSLRQRFFAFLKIRRMTYAYRH